ncbi:hypothetical protein DH2020_009336 [Rehmannia glutinosa]|uniref:Amino acid transporter transmembrane domain-containing protein n=1 Tax=Rehmannia glutinosa TaxID=99300 RepID=A0ABR0X6X0_REHGL
MDTNPRVRSYADIGARAFGARGRTIVSIAIYVQFFMVATGLLILEEDNLHRLFPRLKCQISGLVIGGRQCFILIIGITVLPTVWLDNMNFLSYIYASGVISFFALILSVLWVGFDGVEFHEKGRPFNYKGIPTSISIYAFCYGMHALLPTLYTLMRDQKKFPWVLVICFGVCTLSYAAMAILGYLMFGLEVNSQITLSFPADKVSTKVAIYAIIASPVAKFALMLLPIVKDVENQLMRRPNRGISILLRSGLVISSIVVALIFPLFGYLMTLVGAFFDIALSIILSCVFYMKITKRYLYGFESISMWGIVVVGVLVLSLGTFQATWDIVKHFTG